MKLTCLIIEVVFGTEIKGEKGRKGENRIVEKENEIVNRRSNLIKSKTKKGKEDKVSLS
jgi:hypothetical protein